MCATLVCGSCGSRVERPGNDRRSVCTTKSNNDKIIIIAIMREMGKADADVEARQGRQGRQESRQAVLCEKVKWPQELLVRQGECGA